MAGLVAARHILLVEDEYMIAHEIAFDLALLGVIPVGPVATLQGAMALLKRFDRLDGAVLDINLQGEMVYPLAEKQKALGVPFIFTTGYDQGRIPTQYAKVKRCEQPVPSQQVLQTLFSVMEAKKMLSAAFA